MQFSYALIAAAAVAVANAAVQITNTPQSFVGVTAGQALNISWTGNDGPVTLTLKNGEANALKTVNVIGSGLSGSSFAWVPPTSLPVAEYALQIDDSAGVPNYSVQFMITGGAAASSSAASSASSTGSVTSTGSSSSASATTDSNSTTATSSSSATRTASTTSGSSASRTSAASESATASAPPNSNAGANFASPLAFVLLAFAALMTLN